MTAKARLLRAFFMSVSTTETKKKELLFCHSCYREWRINSSFIVPAKTPVKVYFFALAAGFLAAALGAAFFGAAALGAAFFGAAA